VKPNKGGNAALAQVRVLDDEGQMLAEFKNLELRRTHALETGRQNRTAVQKDPVLDNPAYQSRERLVQHLEPLTRRERITDLSKWLTAEIKDTMGQAADGLDLDNLPPSAAFLEIGLDSLLVTELQRRIQEKLDFRFKPMQGLDYQSIETMAEYIHDDVLAAQLAPKMEAEASAVVN
jgi:acyl carrier protein